MSLMFFLPAIEGTSVQGSIPIHLQRKLIFKERTFDDFHILSCLGNPRPDISTVESWRTEVST